MSAIDQLNEIFITEDELAKFLNVTPERIRDLRSNHKTGKTAFIPYVQPTSKCALYHVDDVMHWLLKSPRQNFVKSLEEE